MGLARKKIALIFGTRPEAIKMAPVWQEIKANKRYFKPVVIVSGQHRQMLEQVLKQFKIKPDYDLKVMQEDQTLAQLSNNIINKLEKLLKKITPDLILVQGDTSTTFLTSLVAFYQKIPVGHIEAGLRTGDMHSPYPEEINRVLTTSLAKLHFAPTARAFQVIRKNQPDPDQVFLTGNTVIDALKAIVSRNGKAEKNERSYILITAHRRESFGGPLKNICLAIRSLAQKYPQFDFLFPVHLNPQVQRTVRDLLGGFANIKLTAPLDYLTFSKKMKQAYLLLTDSGGIQEEAPALGVPVLVLREKTERPEAIQAGAVKLIGTNIKKIISETSRLIENGKYYKGMSETVSPYGDGEAARRIVQGLKYYFGFSNKKPDVFKPIRLNLSKTVRK